MNSQLGERQEFIKKYESDVIEVTGRQHILEEQLESLTESDKQKDLKLNGQTVMIESINYEFEQIKHK